MTTKAKAIHLYASHNPEGPYPESVVLSNFKPKRPPKGHGDVQWWYWGPV